MEYLLPSILTIISYFLGSFLGFQRLRDPVERPLIYTEIVLFILTVFFGWLPVGIAFYLAYININLLFAIILILIRFIIMPSLLNNKLKTFMNKNGI